MKKMFKFGVLLILLINGFASGQNYMNPNAEDLLAITNSQSTNNKIRLKICTTISCCGVGSFSVDIWKDTECHYIITNKNNNESNVVIMNLEDSFATNKKLTTNENIKNLKTIKIENDQILYDPNKTLGDDQAYAMKAGEYKVIDGQIAFEPSVISARSVCWVETHQGQIFGHNYSYSYAFCVKVPFTKNAATNVGGILTIDLSQNQELLSLAQKNNGFLSFDEDMMLNNNIVEAKKAGEKIVVKAGKYLVNEDGIIIVRNFSTIKN
ncbi:hypothetical protein [Epilithonimonas caeni]|uniref:hypothetical protein n=1 Tax=Epilithonimonas caeni TaxID=365343 RepID=UPI0004828C52|nr:hypothetical protein [Epilithonimonas caeni]